MKRLVARYTIALVNGILKDVTGYNSAILAPEVKAKVEANAYATVVNLLEEIRLTYSPIEPGKPYNPVKETKEAKDGIQESTSGD
jgi:hypothetical protein